MDHDLTNPNGQHSLFMFYCVSDILHLINVVAKTDKLVKIDHLSQV